MFGLVIGLIGIGLVVTGIMCLLIDSGRRDGAEQKAWRGRDAVEAEKRRLEWYERHGNEKTAV